MRATLYLVVLSNLIVIPGLSQPPIKVSILGGSELEHRNIMIWSLLILRILVLHSSMWKDASVSDIRYRRISRWRLGSLGRLIRLLQAAIITSISMLDLWVQSGLEEGNNDREWGGFFPTIWSFVGTSSSHLPKLLRLISLSLALAKKWM